jgi:hypothetical protein
MLRQYATEVGVPGIAPHDLRRTCAKLCRAAGGELEQIHEIRGRGRGSRSPRRRLIQNLSCSSPSHFLPLRSFRVRDRHPDGPRPGGAKCGDEARVVTPKPLCEGGRVEPIPPNRLARPKLLSAVLIGLSVKHGPQAFMFESRTHAAMPRRGQKPPLQVARAAAASREIRLRFFSPSAPSARRRVCRLS